jgi:hypothetical protein
MERGLRYGFTRINADSERKSKQLCALSRAAFGRAALRDSARTWNRENEIRG